MRRASAAHNPGVSLFPFLAVLICTMGVMMLLLVIINRPGAAAIDDSEPPPGAVFEEGGNGSAATVASGNGGASGASDELQQQREMLQWRLSQLEISREKTVGDLHDERLRLSTVEDGMRKLRDQWQQVEKAAGDIEQVDKAKNQDKQAVATLVDRLKSDLNTSHDRLGKAIDQARSQPPAFAIIPYDGPNGTRRQPIYIECRNDAIVLQPEGIALTEHDFDGPKGPGNPLASTIRAARDYLAGGTAPAPGGEPYPLLIVRSDGIEAFYMARSAMSSWASEFGYELIEADRKLVFAPANPQLAQVEQAALADARARYAWFATTNTGKEQEQPHERPVYRASRTHGGIEREGEASFADADGASAGSGTGTSGFGGSGSRYGASGAGNGLGGAGTANGIGGSGTGNGGPGIGNGNGTSATGIAMTGGPGGGPAYVPGNGYMGLPGSGGTGGSGDGAGGVPGGSPGGLPGGIPGGGMAGGSGVGSGYGPGNGLGNASGGGPAFVPGSGYMGLPGSGGTSGSGYGTGGSPGGTPGGLAGGQGGGYTGLPGNGGSSGPGDGTGFGIGGAGGGPNGGPSGIPGGPGGYGTGNPGAGSSGIASSGTGTGIGGLGAGTGSGMPGGSAVGYTGQPGSAGTNGSGMPGGPGNGTGAAGGPGSGVATNGTPNGSAGVSGGNASSGTYPSGAQNTAYTALPGSNGSNVPNSFSGSGGVPGGTASAGQSGTPGAGPSAAGALPDDPSSMPPPGTPTSNVTIGQSGGSSGASGNAVGDTSAPSGMSMVMQNNTSQQRPSSDVYNINATPYPLQSGPTGPHPGEYVDSQPVPYPDKPKPPDNNPPQSHDSLAEKRGHNWSLPSTAKLSTPVSRTIHIECRGDRLTLKPDFGNPHPRVIQFGPRTADSVDKLVAAVWDYTKGWGIAGRQMYWRPRLELELGESGEGRFAELQSLLADSGLEVTRKPTAVASVPASQLR